MEYIVEIYKHPDEHPVHYKFNLKKRNDVYAKKMATQMAFKECNNAWFFAVYLLVKDEYGFDVKTYSNEPSCEKWRIKWRDDVERGFSVDLWRKHNGNLTVKPCPL